MALRVSGSLSSASTVPSGSAAKASSVGAKTVYGPAPLSVSTRPAAVAAASNVLNEPASVATSTMSPTAAADSLGASLIGASLIGTSDAGAAVAGAAVAGAVAAPPAEQAAMTMVVAAASGNRSVRFIRVSIQSLVLGI